MMILGSIFGPEQLVYGAPKRKTLSTSAGKLAANISRWAAPAPRRPAARTQITVKAPLTGHIFIGCRPLNCQRRCAPPSDGGCRTHLFIPTK